MSYLAIMFTLLFVSGGNGRATKVKEQGLALNNCEIHKKNKPQPTQFNIKDEKQYSETFLSEFKSKHSIYKSVALMNDTIIINNDRENFILIPTDLPLDRFVTYEVSREGIKYTLTVKRINFSTIEYIYFETVNGKKENKKQGLSDLQAVFYLGAEGTFEDENENVYGMNQYINSSETDCQTSIFIGVGSIEKSFLKQKCKSDSDNFETPLLVIKM